MRKEEVRGLIIYTLLIITAIIVGFAAVKPLMDVYAPVKMSGFVFLILAVIVSYLLNVIGLELLHVLGAVFGGYSITGFNVLGLCFYKTNDTWKFGFRDFDGMSGETKITPKKEKLNPNLVTWFPIFGYAIELASCIVIMSFVKSSPNPKAGWLAPAALVLLLISSMLAFYNFIPIKLDSMTDGYKMRLFAKPVNIKAFNQMLEIENKQRLGETIENIPVFDEITEYTAEINAFAVFMYLSKENYEKAQEILDKLLENKKYLSVNDTKRLLAQKIYIAILTQPQEEAKKMYDELCPTEIRRFIANDLTMQSIRAYILIAGMIENSESEVVFAKSKVEKARKRALASEIQTEEVLLNKALDYVYDNHPKWSKEKAA